MTARGVAAAAVVAAAAGLTACSSPAATTLPGITVQVLQYRSDIPQRRVQLEVVNGSSHAVVVAAAWLQGSGWTPSPRWSDSAAAEIGAGSTVDLPVALTTASCGARHPLSARLRLTDGTTRWVRALDLHGTLARLHGQDCFGQTAARTATFTFRGFRPQGRTAEIDLAVRGGPRVADGLTVVGVLPTTLLSPRDGAETWRIGRRVTASGSVALQTVPSRCDLHAVAEDKIGTVLRVRLRLADGTTGTVDAVAPKPLKNRILAWVVRACGNT